MSHLSTPKTVYCYDDQTGSLTKAITMSDTPAYQEASAPRSPLQMVIDKGESWVTTYNAIDQISSQRVYNEADRVLHTVQALENLAHEMDREEVLRQNKRNFLRTYFKSRCEDAVECNRKMVSLSVSDLLHFLDTTS